MTVQKRFAEEDIPDYPIKGLAPFDKVMPKVIGSWFSFFVPVAQDAQDAGQVIVGFHLNML